VGENWRHFRGLGWRAPLSGRKLLIFRSFRGGFRRRSLLAIFQFSVSAARRLVRLLNETSFAMCLRVGANVHLFIPRRPPHRHDAGRPILRAAAMPFSLSEQMCAGPYQAGASRSSGAIASPMSVLDEKKRPQPIRCKVSVKSTVREQLFCPRSTGGADMRDSVSSHRIPMDQWHRH